MRRPTVLAVGQAAPLLDLLDGVDGVLGDLHHRLLVLPARVVRTQHGAAVAAMGRRRHHHGRAVAAPRGRGRHGDGRGRADGAVQRLTAGPGRGRSPAVLEVLGVGRVCVGVEGASERKEERKNESRASFRNSYLCLVACEILLILNLLSLSNNVGWKHFSGMVLCRSGK